MSIVQPVMCSSVLPQGAVITPAAAIEPSLSLHPSSVMAPLTQQMNHLSLGTTGTVSLSFYLLQTILRCMHLCSSFDL